VAQAPVPAAFDVLRKEGTERPFSSPLDGEKRRGTFVCAGCSLPLFARSPSSIPGTGWPSFVTAIKGSTGSKRDLVLLIPRTSTTAPAAWGTRATSSTTARPPAAASAGATTAWR
jgi:peptide-methionine (R)-S-oxide reductase